MYYNIKKQTVSLLAVLPPYNRRYIWNDNKYFFYDFSEDMKQSQVTLMSYHKMMTNVNFVMKHFNINVPLDVRYCMT
jgi:hypothetical protein